MKVKHITVEKCILIQECTILRNVFVDLGGSRKSPLYFTDREMFRVSNIALEYNISYLTDMISSMLAHRKLCAKAARVDISWLGYRHAFQPGDTDRTV